MKSTGGYLKINHAVEGYVLMKYLNETLDLEYCTYAPKGTYYSSSFKHKCRNLKRNEKIATI